MAVLESLKKVAGKATGLGRPSRDQVEALVRARKANAFAFKDDGVIPNHAHWPLILYRGAISLPGILGTGGDHQICSTRMAGEIRGATESTTTSITIHVFTRCWEL